MAGSDLVDVFNDRYEFIGTETKKKVHRRGLWHRSFSCVVVNPRNMTVVLQLKFPGQYKFDRPDYLDVSVGGHYLAGESIEQGIRELREELGLMSVEYRDLVSLGIRQTAATIATDYVEREFQHLHIFAVDFPLDRFPLGGHEVAALVECPIDRTLDVMLGHTEAIICGVVGAPQLGATASEVGEREVRRADFVPAYLATDQLFVRLFVAARRFCRGERELLFW